MIPNRLAAGVTRVFQKDHRTMNRRDMDEDESKLRARLEELMIEHRDLDDAINALTRDGFYDQLQVQRFKRKKLLLKDEIARLQSRLIPDIIA